MTASTIQWVNQWQDKASSLSGEALENVQLTIGILLPKNTHMVHTEEDGVKSQKYYS